MKLSLVFLIAAVFGAVAGAHLSASAQVKGSVTVHDKTSDGGIFGGTKDKVGKIGDGIASTHAVVEGWKEQVQTASSLIQKSQSKVKENLDSSEESIEDAAEKSKEEGEEATKKVKKGVQDRLGELSKYENIGDGTNAILPIKDNIISKTMGLTGSALAKGTDTISKSVQTGGKIWNDSVKSVTSTTEAVISKTKEMNDKIKDTTDGTIVGGIVGKIMDAKNIALDSAMKVVKTASDLEQKKVDVITNGATNVMSTANNIGQKTTSVMANAHTKTTDYATNMVSKFFG